MKLDSAPDRTATQLLPYNPTTQQASDEYSELGVTAKTQISKTRLSLGTQYPTLPVINGSTARLLPQTFRGIYLTSDDIEQFTLHTGHIDRVNLRDSTNYQSLSLASPNGRFKAGVDSTQFDFMGGEYRGSDALILKYFHAELKDIYTQDYVGLLHSAPLPVGKLRTDIRFFDSRENGSAKAGRVDNRNIGAMFTYLVDGHAFGAGYMRLSGDTSMAYLAGGEPLVLSDGAMSNDFVNPDERVWVVRYDHDFADLGAPGLTGMLRYFKGSNINLPKLGGTDLKESARDLELAYVIQSGPIKGLVLRTRCSMYRNDLSSAATFRNDNETRINIDYT